MDQKFEPLNPDDIADLEAKRTWVRGHYDEVARGKYDTLDEKLRLLDAILQNKWIAPDETLKLQCLGVTFGDALAQNLGLTWVAVEDQYGRDPALVLDGSSKTPAARSSGFGAKGPIIARRSLDEGSE